MANCLSLLAFLGFDLLPIDFSCQFRPSAMSHFVDVLIEVQIGFFRKEAILNQGSMNLHKGYFPVLSKSLPKLLSITLWPVLGNSVPILGHEFLPLWLHFHSFCKILASRAQKTVDVVPSFEIFQIETKLQLQGLNFKLEFWDKNLQNRPWCYG